MRGSRDGEEDLRVNARMATGTTLRRVGRGSWLVPLVGAGAALVFLLESAPIGALPLPEAVPAAQNTRILDREGRLLAVLHGEEDRAIIPRSQMPLHLRLAAVIAEDRGFYRHGGISLPSVLRAAAKNVSNRAVVQGGSTITQQYVRNAFIEVGRERTLGRKVREAVLAVRLEQRYSKDEILDFYLNTVYFGRGAYGVEAAARTYFGKHARDLEPQESAFLAAIIRAPEYYLGRWAEAKSRRDLVLREMAEAGYLTSAEALLARRKALRVRRPHGQFAYAPYFVEYVRRLLRTPVLEGGFGLTDREILTGGLTVHTTLDLDMQRFAEEAVQEVFPFEDDPQVGFAATTTSGEVVAMVGGRTFARDLAAGRGFNYAAQLAQGFGRGTGSAFKPFTLAAFVEEGYSVFSTFRGPSRITIPSCDDWRPGNYGNESYGRLTVVDATAYSVNTVYAQMVSVIRPETVVDMAQRAGIESPLEPFCSITLGVFGVTPLEMARAYSTFATGGRRPDLVAVTRIVGPHGRLVARREPRLVRTISQTVADTVNAVLRRVMIYGTGRIDAIGRPSAGKTGTAQDRLDVWFGGYTPHPGLTAVAWVGYPPDENGRIREMNRLHGRPATGGAFPGRIWKLFMERAVAELPVLDFDEVELGGGRATYARCGGPVPGPSVAPRPGENRVVNCYSGGFRGGGSPSPQSAPPAPAPPPPSPEPCAGHLCPQEPSPSPSEAPQSRGSPKEKPPRD